MINNKKQKNQKINYLIELNNGITKSDPELALSSYIALKNCNYSVNITQIELKEEDFNESNKKKTVELYKKLVDKVYLITKAENKSDSLYIDINEYNENWYKNN